MNEEQPQPVIVKLQSVDPIRIKLIEDPLPERKSLFQRLREPVSQLWNNFSQIAENPQLIRTFEWPRVVVVVFITFVLFLVVFLAGRSFAQDYFFSTEPTSGIAYKVYYPKYLALGQEERISVTLVNTKPFSLAQVNATLVFVDDAFVSIQGANRSNVINFGPLPPDGGKTDEFTIKVERFPTQSLLRFFRPQAIKILLRVETINDKFAVRFDTPDHDLGVSLFWKQVGRWFFGVAILSIAAFTGNILKDLILSELKNS